MNKITKNILRSSNPVALVSEQEFHTSSCSSMNDKKYTVAVVATMSAGKSTLLNAIMGEELLPAKNEACTETIFQIENHDKKDISIARYIADGKCSQWYSMEKYMLEEWNALGYQRIEIQGEFPHIKNTPHQHKVVFWDTPGPNNALKDSHAQIVNKMISEADYCSLVCVLDVSVLGVKDEWRLLTLIKYELDKRRNSFQPIFVINKIDLLDIERGEKPFDVLSRVQAYLEEQGFAFPIIIPTCSHLSLTIRKTLLSAQKMTKKEVRKDYCGVEKLKSFFQHRYKATTTPRQQNSLRNKIKMILELEQEYNKALNHNTELQVISEELKKRPVPTPRRKIKIADEYFTYRDLYRADNLSGVPYLEKIVECKLNQYIPNHQRSE